MRSQAMQSVFLFLADVIGRCRNRICRPYCNVLLLTLDSQAVVNGKQGVQKMSLMRALTDCS
jgi:hypothetical protein